MKAHLFTGEEQTSDGLLLRAELPGFISEPYVILYSSADLKVWKEEARIHNANRIRYLAPSATNEARFFKFTHFETVPSDWSNQISVYSEPYGSYNAGIPYVKFVIKTDEPELTRSDSGGHLSCPLWVFTRTTAGSANPLPRGQRSSARNRQATAGIRQRRSELGAGERYSDGRIARRLRKFSAFPTHHPPAV